MKPFNKYVGPKEGKKESEDLDKPARTIVADKVSELMRETYKFSGTIIANWTETYLGIVEYGKNHQYYCSRFYPELKIALDKFYTKTEYDRGGVELKKKLLNAHGIKYVVLTPAVSFEEAIMTAEVQKVK